MRPHVESKEHLRWNPSSDASTHAEAGHLLLSLFSSLPGKDEAVFQDEPPSAKSKTAGFGP